MLDDHEADVSRFQKAADDAKDPNLKAFAATMLPTLKQHSDEVKAIDKAMPSTGTPAANPDRIEHQNSCHIN